MVFSSLLFLFRFLPLTIILYLLVPGKFKNLILVMVSLGFYSFGEPKYVMLMCSSIVVDYVIGILIDGEKDTKFKRKIFLFISLSFNIGILFAFKYFNFFINSFGVRSNNIIDIALPLGISFYTFQTMSYSIDVYRKRIEAEKNFIDFAAFVTLFPQLIAGPIVKYSQIRERLKNPGTDFYKLENGIRLFILGLGRKVLIANNIGILWKEIEVIGFENISSPLGVLGAIAFTIQIYFDFSGYSMMARGLGSMFGFEFPKNFNYPFIARSISEFWRRWHITLGSWFKEYVYIELGGNRVGIIRTIINLFIVWSITGLWHGASYSFLLWGIYFFFFIGLEKVLIGKFLEKHKIFSHFYTIIVIIFSFLIFSISNISDLIIYISRLFTFSGGVRVFYYVGNYFFIILIALYFSTPLCEKIYIKYISKYSFVEYSLLILIFTFSIAYLVDSTYNPFLYFRF